MANEKKQAIIYGLVNEVLVELMAKTNIENVVYSVGEDGTEVYLSTKLAEILADIATRAKTSEVESKIAALRTELMGEGVPEAYDTFKELADYIAAHQDVSDALTEAIGNKADKSVVEAIQSTVTALGALAKKDKVSESDLDTALAEKVNAASEGNHAHANKTVLDGITEGKVSAWDAAEQNAKDYADGLAGNYDSKGSAAAAEAAAKAYADGLADNYDTKGAAAAAETAAKEYADGLNTAMGTRVGTVEGKVETLVGADASKSARQIAAEETAKIVAGADTAYDTLKEIAAWISTHGSDAATMQSNIVAIQNQLSGIAAGNGTVKKYVDDAIAALNVGQYALAADLTALAARVTAVEGKVSTAEGKITALEGKAHEHSNKAVLDGITADLVTEWNSKGSVFVQSAQPANMTAGDLWIKIQ